MSEEKGFLIKLSSGKQRKCQDKKVLPMIEILSVYYRR